MFCECKTPAGGRQYIYRHPPLRPSLNPPIRPFLSPPIRIEPLGSIKPLVLPSAPSKSLRCTLKRASASFQKHVAACTCNCNQRAPRSEPRKCNQSAEVRASHPVIVHISTTIARGKIARDRIPDLKSGIRSETKLTRQIWFQIRLEK